MIIVKPISYFVLAGLYEISGGYLVWLWLREGKPIFYGVVGVMILVIYSVITTISDGSIQRRVIHKQR